MTAEIINGKEFAEKLTNNLKEEVQKLVSQHSIVPCLAIIQVGDNFASNIYINNKIKKCAEVGIKNHLIKFSENIQEQDLVKTITEINNDKKIHGIIVQLPIPQNIAINNIINLINPSKDVDGFHPLNVGKLLVGGDGFVPCTPQGCLMLIKSKIENLAGKKALIIGRSNIVGKPMSYLLLKENCTVTIAHSYTQNIEIECKNADIIIAAIGKSNFIKGEWIKNGALVIDVGINYDGPKGERKITGDVDFGEACKHAFAITPVPGGVGPMTVACLLKNTVLAAKRSLSLT